jgi:hypothetical protein
VIIDTNGLAFGHPPSKEVLMEKTTITAGLPLITIAMFDYRRVVQSL